VFLRKKICVSKNSVLHLNGESLFEKNHQHIYYTVLLSSEIDCQKFNIFKISCNINKFQNCAESVMGFFFWKIKKEETSLKQHCRSE